MTGPTDVELDARVTALENLAAELRTMLEELLDTGDAASMVARARTVTPSS